MNTSLSRLGVARRKVVVASLITSIRMCRRSPAQPTATKRSSTTYRQAQSKTWTTTLNLKIWWSLVPAQRTTRIAREWARIWARNQKSASPKKKNLAIHRPKNLLKRLPSVDSSRADLPWEIVEAEKWHASSSQISARPMMNRDPNFKSKLQLKLKNQRTLKFRLICYRLQESTK